MREVISWQEGCLHSRGLCWLSCHVNHGLATVIHGYPQRTHTYTVWPHATRYNLTFQNIAKNSLHKVNFTKSQAHTHHMSSPVTQYRCIGRGFCGTVWALEDTQHMALTAIKREDGGPGRSLANDHNMHLRVIRAMERYQLNTALSVPQCHKLIEPTDLWWQTQLCRFPRGYEACKALISERIPKIPRSISNKLLDFFCAGNEALASFVKTNEGDDSCLIRPYLGRRRRHRQEGTSNSRLQRFSLRNVPLHIDQMEALSLDTKAYAETMADALALMLWVAKIDANDVEFVLAPPRRPPDSRSSCTFQCEFLGEHGMWILDFDCCRAISLDEVGVEQACAAFFKNDPFYPRPGGGEKADEVLWVAFKRKFLSTSWKILGGDDVWLAERFMGRVEEEGLLRRQAKKQLV